MKKMVFLVLAFTFLCGAGLTSPIWAAYSAHQNDTDINNFLTVYPSAKSTKLDDCALCHPGGKITQNGKTTTYGSCDYCHNTYGLVAPHGSVPLNPYGQAYKGAGRGQQAILNIANLDSDGDKYANIVEIQALTFPGDAGDYPGLVPAPAVGLNLERILKLPEYSEFLLLNASNSRDFYARYRGVKIMDLLKYAGVSKNATQIRSFHLTVSNRLFPSTLPILKQTLRISSTMLWGLIPMGPITEDWIS